MKSKIMKFFSDLGRSLMMPVAALAACGIILGITSALLKTQVQDAVPFLTASVPLFIITTLNKVSGIVFTLLPVLFAISIAFGLAKEDKGVAAFAGFIGYYTFLVASSCMISTGIMDFSAMKISNILGVDTVDMGALAGIMAGLVTAKLHNKYHKVQFPAAIAFYGGKRFVALVVLVSMTVIGLVMPLIWAPISVGIDGLGRIIRSSGAFGVFIFGTLERLLIPTGLHHVLNSLFRTTAIGGTYHGVEGCLNIFLQFLDQAPLSDMKPYTQFLGQGKMPYDTYRLLPYLFDDHELENAISNKIFLGFSDTTFNHFMFHKVGMNTFYGQAFLTDICEIGSDMPAYTKKYFTELIETGMIKEIRPSDVWYEDRTDFSAQKIGTSLKLHPNRGYELLCGKPIFSGKILGGCIDSIYDFFCGDRYEDTPILCEKYHLFPKKEEWVTKQKYSKNMDLFTQRDTARFQVLILSAYLCCLYLLNIRDLLRKI